MEYKPILIITAVEAEKEAVLKGLQGASGFEVYAAGVGPIAAAVQTAILLSSKSYRLVISAGIGGGFAGIAQIGDLVVATEIIGAELGVETEDGFSSLEQLGYGSSRVKVDLNVVNQLLKSMQATAIHVVTGPLLTVSTATGRAATALELATRITGAAAEAMEGYGVASAAAALQIPVLEMRAISNMVGTRDRKAWRIPEALETLQAASSVLREVFNENRFFPMSQ